MVPVESGLPSTWAATEDNKFKWVLASKGFGCDEYGSTIFQSWVSCLRGDSKFIGSNKHIPGSSRSDFTKDFGSKPIAAGSVICPRKNSSGVLNGIPMLVASPLESISDFVTC